MINKVKSSISIMKRDKNSHSIQLFEDLNKLVGKRIDEIVFYLEHPDHNFSEVPNIYGKSFHSGIDIKIGNIYYSIGCRFFNIHNGLTITEGRTTDFEFIEDEKNPVIYKTKLIGQIIESIDIYWMEIPWDNIIGLYPQEFVIKTSNDFFLLSSIEINYGEVSHECTDELLIIEKENIAKQLKLGPYGVEENDRLWFKSFDELFEYEKKNF